VPGVRLESSSMTCRVLLFVGLALFAAAAQARLHGRAPVGDDSDFSPDDFLGRVAGADKSSAGGLSQMAMDGEELELANMAQEAEDAKKAKAVKSKTTMAATKAKVAKKISKAKVVDKEAELTEDETARSALAAATSGGILRSRDFADASEAMHAHAVALRKGLHTDGDAPKEKDDSEAEADKLDSMEASFDYKTKHGI